MKTPTEIRNELLKCFTLRAHYKITNEVSVAKIDYYMAGLEWVLGVQEPNEIAKRNIETESPLRRFEEEHVLQAVQEKKPYGIWTRCSCGHIAQAHNLEGKCEELECRCTHYDGKCNPTKLPPLKVELPSKEECKDWLQKTYSHLNPEYLPSFMLGVEALYTKLGGERFITINTERSTLNGRK